ncbi:Hypothetical predicted protein, partial [Olea europaea subsp. europaea]
AAPNNTEIRHNIAKGTNDKIEFNRVQMDDTETIKVLATPTEVEVEPTNTEVKNNNIVQPNVTKEVDTIEAVPCVPRIRNEPQLNKDTPSNESNNHKEENEDETDKTHNIEKEVQQIKDSSQSLDSKVIEQSSQVSNSCDKKLEVNQCEQIPSTDKKCNNKTALVKHHESPRKTLLHDSVKFIISEEPVESIFDANDVTSNEVIIIPPADDADDPPACELLIENVEDKIITKVVNVVSDEVEEDQRNTSQNENKTDSVDSKSSPNASKTKKQNNVGKRTKPKYAEKQKKSPVESKQSPNLLKEILNARIVSTDKRDTSATKHNNLSLDFLNASCKVTPVVKNVCTPKRKSSSTPRRSYVRALKFETPLKTLKRKCNTSPKECKNQDPIIFERPGVSRNLSEDVEMKKDVPASSRLPWDYGVRQMIVSTLPETGGRRRRIKRKHKTPLDNAQGRKTPKKRKIKTMKTIDENNELDQTLDKTVEKKKPGRAKRAKDKNSETPNTANHRIIDTDVKSNEGSLLSLNLDDTPLKIPDFEEDIHKKFKTPEKDNLLPAGLGLTPIDSIIRNNIGESASLMKIIEDINMFKETPIKDAFERFEGQESPSKEEPQICSKVSHQSHSIAQEERIIDDNSDTKSCRDNSVEKRSAKRHLRSRSRLDENVQIERNDEKRKRPTKNNLKNANDPITNDQNKAVNSSKLKADRKQ